MPPDSGPLPQASLFAPGANCEAVARADRVSLIIDGQDYYRAFMRAAERAERSIVILAWDFDSRTALDFDGDGKPEITLGEFLDNLAKRNRKLRIHILDWDYPMIFGTGREFPLSFGITWHPHRRIDFRYDDTHPLTGSHHQKVVVIDDKVAFCGGLDLTSKRWDTPEHKPEDPRRTWEDKPYPPFHDTMIAVDGEAARALGRVARHRWKLATNEEIVVPKSAGDPWPKELPVHVRDVNVAVSVTSPPQDGHEAQRQVEQLYLDMIARAKKYIYIENQYFTSQRIGEALEARLGDPDGPEIIVLTRLLSHGWLEEVTMTNLRTRLVRRLRDADKHGKLRVYYPHRGGLCEGTCIDLHSKLMIVDDEWLRIGSSNLSNRSMAVDTECDVTIEARGEERVRKVIRHFLGRLLSEHSLATIEEVEENLSRHAPSLAAAIDASPGPEERSIRKLEAEELPEGMLNIASIGDPETPISLDGLVQNLAPIGDPIPARRGRAMLGGLLILVVALAFVWRYTPLAEVVSPATAIEWARDLAGHWWAPAIVVAAYTPASVVLLPRWIITLAAVLAFGPWQGFLYAQLGVVIAAVLGYFLGRIVHRDTVQRIAGHGINRVSRLLQRRGIVAVTLVRLVPIAPFIVVNAVMGAMRIRLRHFVLGTIFGMLPGMLATTVLGDQIAALLANPLRFNVWMLVAALALVSLAGYGARQWVKRRKP